MSKIIDLADDDYKLVNANMSKCSTYFTGHDTAGTLIEKMLDSNEFLADLKILDDYIKDSKKRRQ